MRNAERIAYRFGGFRLDPVRRVLLSRDGRPIALGARAFDALLCLVERPGALVERQELLRTVWPKAVVHENNLDQAVSAVRRALGETPDAHRFIVTEPGRGYRFVAHVETIPLEDSGAASADVGPGTLRPDAAGSAALSRIEGLTATKRRYRALLAVTAAAAAIAIAAVIPNIWKRGDSSDPAGPKVTPLSFEKGGQRSAVWSPDGSAIAFAARSALGEPFQLHLRTMDSRVRPVVRLDDSAVVKQWTTAGRLLFTDREGLWSVSPTAGADAELLKRMDGARFDLSDAGIDVTRDGSAVAVLGRGDDGRFGLWTAAAPSWNLEKYEPAPFAARRIVNRPFLRFSPDGERLLLMRNAGEGEQAWLLPFPPESARPPRRVLESLRAVSGTPQFSWLPDNRRIVASVAIEARRALYIVDTDSGEWRLLSRGHRDQLAPVVSPEGDKLVFAELRKDLDVVTLDLATVAAAPLIATRREEQMPAWAAGTEALVYVTDRSGAQEIWLHRPGQADRPLITASDFSTATQWFIAPALSPDGKRVIYQRVEKGKPPARLWVSSVDGGRPQRVTTEQRLEGAGSWSPDGAWYVYRTLERDGWSKLKKVRTRGQAEPVTLLETVQSNPFVPAWSPDGDWVLIADGGMKLVSPDGGTPRALGIENAACTFARAETELYCIRSRQVDGAHRLVALDLDGRVRRIIGSVPPGRTPASSLSPGIRLSLTPDGAGLTYAAGPASQDLWLMEGISMPADR